MMNSDIIRVVENEAAARSAARRRALEEKRALVLKRCPRALEIEKEINASAVDFAQRIMEAKEGAGAMEAAARDALAAKRREQAGILVSCGLPADLLEESFICPECRDTGFVSGALCRCMRQPVINSCFAGSGIDPNESFESFRFDLLKDKKQQNAVKKIYDYCMAFADSFPENEQEDLLLFGNPGVGKTYLLNCIGGRVLGKGYSVLKLTSHRLIQTVLDSLHNSSEQKPDYLLPDLLIIDDLGAEPMLTNITIETLISVICERQDSHKHMLIATNFDIDQIADNYGTRIQSRLLSPNTVRLININTDSVRVTK